MGNISNQTINQPFVVQNKINKFEFNLFKGEDVFGLAKAIKAILDFIKVLL